MTSPLLLDDRLFPITATIGLVQADVGAVEAVLSDLERARLARSNPKARLTRTAVSGSLTQVLSSVLPLSTFATRLLFVSLRNGWTAVFGNGVRGPDPRGPVGVAVGGLRCLGLVAMVDPPEVGGQPRHTAHAGGAVGFILYDADSPGALHERRSVIVSRQGSRGWDFDVLGDPMPFEDLNAYQRRNKRDRLPLDLLVQYLAALGVDPLSEDAYDPARSILTDVHYPELRGLRGRSRRPREFTLDQARAHLAGGRAVG